MKTEQQDKFLKITKQASIPFVVAGVAAADVSGHVLSEDGAIALIEAVEAGETAQAALAGVQAELATANSTLATAQASLNTAQADLKTAQDEVVSLKAEVAKLGKQDGGRFSAADGENPDADAGGEERVLSQTEADAIAYAKSFGADIN